MSRKSVFIVLALTGSLSVLGATLALAKDDMDQRGERGGSVVRCSLNGVNPAFHPEVFANPAAAARDYGFVRSRDGSWHVQENCSTRSPILSPRENDKR